MGGVQARVARAARSRRSYHHGDLRRSLVAAAAKLLDRHGPAGVTLRGAARLAGVSQAAPYRHFAGKEALLAAVAAEAFLALKDACAAAVAADPGDAVHRLEVVAVAYVRYAVEHPARYRLMWAPSPRGRDHPGLAEAARTTADPLLVALSACLPEGTAGEATMQRLFVLWSLLHGIAGLILDEQIPHEVLETVPLDALVRSSIQVAREGLLAPVAVPRDARRSRARQGSLTRSAGPRPA
jgi:AcrR family transcriptional regulator